MVEWRKPCNWWYRFISSDCIEVVRKRVIGKENFVAEDEEELTFEEGDFIAIYEWDDPEWWKGEFNNECCRNVSV